MEALLPNLPPTMFGEVAAQLPFCLAGARACPPEDCGGPGGHAELLAVLADPAHPAHAAMCRWAGADFDPAAFSARQLNRELRLRAGRRGSTP